MTLNAAFIGQGRLLIACADAWMARGHVVGAVVTAEAMIASWAEARGLTVIDPSTDLEAALAPLAPDYLFSIVNHAVLPESVLALARLGAINFHDSLLPRYAGFNATSWAIWNGETSHGVTWHLMSGEADSGGVLVQQRLDILPEDTAFTLSARCDGAGAESFETLLAQIEAHGHTAPLTALKAAEARQDFRLRHERPGLAIVNFDGTAAQISAHLRALDLGREDSWLARPKLRSPNGLFIIDDARIDLDRGGAPGTVLSMDETALIIAAADRALVIETLHDLDGRPILLSATGLKTGDRLASRDETRIAEEIAADAALSRSERFWVRRLASLAPPQIAELRPHDGAVDAQTMTRPCPLSLRGRSRDDRARLLIAALSAYIVRTQEDSLADLTLFKSNTSPMREAYARGVPLRLDLKASATGAKLLTEIDGELTRQAARGTYARDAVTRYRSLSGAQAPRLGSIGLTLDVDTQATEMLGGGVHIALVIGDENQGLHWAYDRAAMEDDAFARFVARIERILEQLAADQTAPLTALDLLTDAERENMLVTWQATETPVPGPHFMHEIFAAQVARTPDAVALVFRGQEITYRALDARANALAHILKEKGAKPDVLIGVSLNRSIEMMIALLAVMKSGSAYVPMDPAYPRERLAMMLEDTKAPILITSRLLDMPAPSSCTVLYADDVCGAQRTDAPVTHVTPDHLAYVIFTSGSTGRPKGVMVTHANAANFFAGMDQRLGTEPGTWLAATSISFDISVLELFWTLGRGFKIVLQPESDRTSLEKAAAVQASSQPVAFSLFYFAATSGAEADTYRLLIEGTRFADAHGFSAVWTPERHFHEFGGLYPNPAITSAALASVTSRIALRAGSVVLPLHDPVRVAEDWSLVDQLSGGRVGLSFASGWHANDFALMPDAYEARRDVMSAHIETVKTLWRGDAIERVSGNGKPVSIKTFPRPIQAAPPMWITAAGNPESFRLAGEMGAHLLTNMLGQDLPDLTAKIAIYRKARAAAGHEGAGTVSVMLHTFVCEDTDTAREAARAPFCNYLMSAYDLIKVAPSMFPAFRQPSLGVSDDTAFDAERFTDEDLSALLDHAFERYFETAGLFGTPQHALKMIEALKRAGVTEVACLVDFGIDQDRVLSSLTYLDALRTLSNPGDRARAEDDLSLADAIGHHGVTHFQCTPSAARLLTQTEDALASLRPLKRLLVGGEALPQDLADTLARAVPGEVINMYGPTETTVWSTTARVEAGTPVTIGTPIANTVIRILDAHGSPAPIGVAGELCIGGAGVVRGYLGRDDLTAERFIADPVTRGGRLYRTGDLARYRSNGSIDFIGRMDGQIKINGYRVELGEIETVLTQPASVAAAVVVMRKEQGSPALAAYVIRADAAANDNHRTQSWQALWDQAYRTSGTADARFNISGWTSRLTGEPIAAEDMRAWLDETDARILALKPSRVLEIGCGTGMVLYRILPHIDHYTGLDLSQTALDLIDQTLTREERRKVTLKAGAAHELGTLDDGLFDTIILNSVVQYFPDRAYLERVIAAAAQRLAPGGHIFIGDVRSFEHLEAFHALRLMEQSADDRTADALRGDLVAAMKTEPELTLSPDVFQGLPGLGHTRMQLKAHDGALELCGFRYDVILSKSAAPPTHALTACSARAVNDIAAALKSAPDYLYVEGLDNARLVRAIAAHAALTRGGARDAASLRAVLADVVPNGAIDPGDLFGMNADYRVETRWSETAAQFDVLFSAKRAAPVAMPERPRAANAALSNTPFVADTGIETFVADLRAHAARHLPSYMIPSSITVLKAFPQTPNGKIDRKALPAPMAAAAAPQRVFADAVTQTQEIIAGVWRALLGLERVSVTENMFDMGANSLLTVQASQRISARLGRKIPLVWFFRHPTIESLAAALDKPSETAMNDTSEDAARQGAQQSVIQRRRDLRKARDA